MENASKALIIAGAILLAILLISLGIMIYTQASGVVNTNAMSEVEISSFNKKFTQYGSSNVRGSQINALIDAIIQNNLSNSGDDSRKVSLTQVGATTSWETTSHACVTDAKITTSSDAAVALSGKTYNVTYTPNSTTGLVEKITITATN